MTTTITYAEALELHTVIGAALASGDTADLARTLESYGLRFAETADEPESVTWRYAVVMAAGVRGGGPHGTILEVAPFDSATRALRWAMRHLGESALSITEPGALPHGLIGQILEDEGEHLELTGFTIERYTDSNGETDGYWSLNGSCKPSATSKYTDTVHG